MKIDDDYQIVIDYLKNLNTQLAKQNTYTVEDLKYLCLIFYNELIYDFPSKLVDSLLITVLEQIITLENLSFQNEEKPSDIKAQLDSFLNSKIKVINKYQ